MFAGECAPREPRGSIGAGGDDLLNSPTFTSPVVTMQGVILGSAAYMAPPSVPVDGFGKITDARSGVRVDATTANAPAIQPRSGPAEHGFYREGWFSSRVYTRFRPLATRLCENALSVQVRTGRLGPLAVPSPSSQTDPWNSGQSEEDTCVESSG